MTRPNQGLSSLAPGGSKMRDPGNKVGILSHFILFLLMLLSCYCYWAGDCSSVEWEPCLGIPYSTPIMPQRLLVFLVRNKLIQQISYYTNCFSYAASQNAGNPEFLKSSINSIVPPSFGEHSSCNITWCGFKKCHTELPNGKSLHGDPWKMPQLTSFLNMPLILFSRSFHHVPTDWKSKYHSNK